MNVVLGGLRGIEGQVCTRTREDLIYGRDPLSGEESILTQSELNS